MSKISGHHPSIEVSVEIDKRLADGAIENKHWGEALRRVESALTTMGSQYTTCFGCATLILPVFRQKSEVLFQLGDLQGSQKWNLEYTILKGVIAEKDREAPEAA